MDNNQRTGLLAGMLVTFVFGSIHSFSVLLVPIELRLETGRAGVSLLYSLALIFLTLSVLFGHLIYNRLVPAWMVFWACAVAGLGLVLSAVATKWGTMFVGYSVLYGAANGVGYGYVLQLMARISPENKAFSMAAVTAAYAVGSVVFSVWLAWMIQRYGLEVCLLVMAAIVVVSGCVSALLLSSSGLSYSNISIEPITDSDRAGAALFLWWLAYGCSVFAGLMAIGHAAGIVVSLGGTYADSIWGAVWIGTGSAMGGFAVGAIISRASMNRYLIGLPLLSAVSLLSMTVLSSFVVAIFVLSLVGFSYGAIIAIYPFAVSEVFGNQSGPKIYGRIFTAWGFAGLCGPWIAGKLFDVSGDYSLALSIAAVIAIASSGFYWIISKRMPHPHGG